MDTKTMSSSPLKNQFFSKKIPCAILKTQQKLENFFPVPEDKI